MSVNSQMTAISMPTVIIQLVPLSVNVKKVMKEMAFLAQVGYARVVKLFKKVH